MFDNMPWWVSAIIIILAICVVFIFLLIVIKNNKDIDATAEIGDNSFGLQVQSSNNNNQSINEKTHQTSLFTEYEFIKSYIMSILDSHSLITSVFTMIANKEDYK